MNRQEFFREKYRAKHPEWRDCLKVYIDMVSEAVGPETRVLDIGCGHADWLDDVYGRTPHVHGLDPDAAALGANVTVRHKHIGTADVLPFADASFDLVVSAFVLEHLDDPRKSFQEIARVLASGGRFVFLTPNAWNYNVWLIRAVPEMFHDFFTRRLYGRGERDTYPKRYRANTPRRIYELCGDSGLVCDKMIMNADPTYVGLNRPLFYAACALENLFDLPRLNKLRVHMVGTCRKP